MGTPIDEARAAGAPQGAALFRAAVRPIREFFALEAASGIVLLASAAVALAWSNLVDAASYRALVEAPVGLRVGSLDVAFTVRHVVNDGLMTFFFFLVGMEIKEELTVGELRSPGQAVLPLAGALGGMAVPAAIYAAFNRGGPGLAGWGVPMATDIAFAIGVLTLLRSRVPHALVVFVTALAIFDDIGGILVIALFYGHGVDAAWLAASAAIAAGLVALGRAGMSRPVAWIAGGALLWFAFHRAGIHATLAGVALGLAIPARPRVAARDVLAAVAKHAEALAARCAAPDRDPALDAEDVLGIERTLEEREAPVARFSAALHPWVAFGIVPLFAFANSGVEASGLSREQLSGAVTVGTAVALFAGKQIGIFAFTAAAVKLGLAPVPGGAGWGKLLGASIVAGIGFTVAIFVAGLAFPGRPDLLDEAKVGILAGSLAAGIVGALALLATPRLPARPGPGRASRGAASPP